MFFWKKCSGQDQLQRNVYLLIHINITKYSDRCHSFPISLNASIWICFFNSSFKGFTFPLTLNALTVSQSVKAWSARSAEHSSWEYFLDISDTFINFCLLLVPVLNIISHEIFRAWCNSIQKVSVSGLLIIIFS